MVRQTSTARQRLRLNLEYWVHIHVAGALSDRAVCGMNAGMHIVAAECTILVFQLICFSESYVIASFRDPPRSYDVTSA